MKLFAQRFWQPTSACMTCMPGSLAQIPNAAHWAIALETGLGTGALVLLITFTPAVKIFSKPLGNALMVAVLTILGDAYSHAHNGGIRPVEVVITGLTSGLFALVASYLLADRAARVRSAWRSLAQRWR